MKIVSAALLIFCLIAGVSSRNALAQPISEKPVRLAIAGMTHGHIAFILGRKDKGDFKLVGAYEPDQELANSLAKKIQVQSGPDLQQSGSNAR